MTSAPPPGDHPGPDGPADTAAELLRPTRARPAPGRGVAPAATRDASNSETARLTAEITRLQDELQTRRTETQALREEFAADLAAERTSADERLRAAVEQARVDERADATAEAQAADEARAASEAANRQQQLDSLRTEFAAEMQAHRERADRAVAELSRQLSAERDELSGQIAELTRERDELSTRLGSTEARLAAADRHVHEADHRASQATIDHDQHIAELGAAFDERADELAAQARQQLEAQSAEFAEALTDERARAGAERDEFTDALQTIQDDHEQVLVAARERELALTTERDALRDGLRDTGERLDAVIERQQQLRVEHAAGRDDAAAAAVALEQQLADLRHRADAADAELADARRAHVAELGEATRRAEFEATRADAAETRAEQAEERANTAEPYGREMERALHAVETRRESDAAATAAVVAEARREVDAAKADAERARDEQTRHIADLTARLAELDVEADVASLQRDLTQLAQASDDVSDESAGPAPAAVERIAITD